MVVEGLANDLEGIDMRHAAADQAVAQHLDQIADMPLPGVDPVQQVFWAAVRFLLDRLQLGQPEAESMLTARPLDNDLLHQDASVRSTPFLKSMFSV